jgi:Protein of unknown function (DUF3300)
MKIRWQTALRKTLSIFLSFTVVASTSFTLASLDGFAQSATPPAPPKLDANTLDTIVARIALYPDPLLAQVLAAASFSDQIPDAYKWVQAHSSLKGDALVQAMESAQLPYDPSVQALIPFPTVMKQLNDDPTWAATLGGAVLTQRGDVMDAVQRMRKKAHDVGNLKTTQQTKVIVESSPQVIEIQPANPQVVYVPVYNPTVVYAPAPPPPPGPSTGTVVAAALIGFAAGVAITAAFSDGWWGYHGGFGWSSHTVVVCNSAWGRTWVNHTTYVHTWGGYNAGFYSRPNAWVNNNTWVNRNTNINVNRNINVNNNVNVNRNQNFNRNTNMNQNRNYNQNQNRNYNQNHNYNQNQNRTANRGYTQSSANRSAFSGVGNGRGEARASARGRFHR